MPALPSTALIRPVETTLSMAAVTEPPQANMPPTTMPMNREEKTSLVIRASPMATTGGTRAQKVA